jgi:uncharacterized protein (TIGR03437 family)
MRLLALTGCLASPVGAQSYTLVTEPDQGLTAIYHLISSAKSTLDMTMYEFNDTQAEQLLAQAVLSGVTVRVILDQNLEKSANTPAYNYLNSHGVQVHWANPAYSATHQKTITVDGATTAIMTLNLTSQYYSTTRDFAVIENDRNDIAAIEATFDADFQASPVTPPEGDGLAWSPTNSQSAILSVIDAAKQSLLVENEEMSDTNIVNALMSAARRGVLVQVTMTNTSDEYSSEFNRMAAAGVRVSTYASTASLYIHAKVVLADHGSAGSQVFVGSENFSSASLTRNRELGLTLSDPAIMQSLAGTLTGDFNGGTPWPGGGSGFSLNVGAPSLTVGTGSAKTSTVTAAGFGNFNSAVALTASGLPSGVTATFTPPSIVLPGSGTATLQLSAQSSTAAGTYSIAVTGTGGGLTEVAGLSLTIVTIDVVNAASFQAGVVPGAWATIFATNLSPVTDNWTSSIVNGMLPTSLDGVTVTVGGQRAYIEYVSPTQINAVAPNAGPGTVPVTVSAPNGVSTTTMVIAQTVQPAFFQWGAYAVATHNDYTYAAKNGAFSETTVPAAPGDTIILWGTGFGPTNPTAPVGAEAPSGTTWYTASAVTVTLGNTPATVYGAALAPGFAGLYQVAIQIPESLADGDYPVVATVSGARSPDNVLLTVLSSIHSIGSGYTKRVRRD